MSGTLQIGRANPLTNLAKWNIDGDRIEAAGLIPTAVIADAKTLRQHLLGYVDNPDVNAIPITYTTDSTVDGFYQLDSARVSVDSPGRLAIGYFPYELALTRLKQYSLPLIESILFGALRTNAATIASGTEVAWIAIPAAAKNVAVIGGPGWGLASGARTSADGVLNLYTSTVIATVDHDCRVQFLLTPANFYIGAALLEVGSPLVRAIGRQIPQTPTLWRLSNGLLRVSADVSSGNSLRLSISPYDGTQWDTALSFSFTNHGSGEMTTTTPIGITVLRNAPEETIIRISLDGGGTLDLLLRRGARLVYGSLTLPFATNKIGIIPTVNVAATSLTAGLRKTTNDGGGNRLVVASPDTVTKDTATGEVYLTAAGKTFNFAVGFEVPGGTGTAYEQAQQLINQYMGADTEQMRIVGR